MLIILGTRLSRKKLGHVANFCVYCRDIRKVRIDRLQMKKHVYYISYKAESDPWNMHTCMECGGQEEVEEEDFSQILKRSDIDIERLISATNPWIRSTFKKRIALEQEVKASPLKMSTDKRIFLIREPFSALAPQIERIYNGEMHISWKTLLLIMTGAFSIITMCAITSSHEYTPSHSTLTSASWTVAIFFIIAIITSMCFESRRRVKRKHLGLLVRALKPLEPKQEELQQIADFYKITKGNLRQPKFVDFRQFNIS